MSTSKVYQCLLWSLAGLCFLVLIGHIPIIWTLFSTKFGFRNAEIFLNYSTFAGSEFPSTRGGKRCWLTCAISILSFRGRMSFCVPSMYPLKPKNEAEEESRSRYSTWNRVPVGEGAPEKWSCQLTPCRHSLLDVLRTLIIPHMGSHDMTCMARAYSVLPRLSTPNVQAIIVFTVDLSILTIWGS